MLNTELVKVLEHIVSLGSSIPNGGDRAVIEQLTRQYAATTNVSFTEEEMKEVMDYEMNELVKSNVTTYNV